MVIAVDDGPSVSLGDDLGKRLRDSSRRSGRSPQELVREAVTDLLDAQQEYRLPSWVGAWSAPPGTIG